MASNKNPAGSRVSVFSWCFYDWANSAFSTVIITFIYSVYFAEGIVRDKLTGSIYWGNAIAISGVMIAILGPVLGAIADHSPHRKVWIAAFSGLCILCSAGLFWGEPDPAMSNIIFVLALIVLANVGFELSQVFYNAMLTHIAPAGKIGRISGWGWAMGYAGGLACLVLTLFGLVGFGETEPFLPVSGAESVNIRASGPLVALWFLVFMVPLMLWTKDPETKPMVPMRSVRAGLGQLKSTVKEIRKHGNLLRFLIASALYRDGLVNLFSIGGIYAAGQYGMNYLNIVFFAIALNISAAFGSYVFSYVDDWIGSRMTVILGLFGLVFTGLIILTVLEKETFMILSVILGIFIGPVQAASRTFVGRVSPPGMTNQMYGFYAFTGKSVAFLGPLVYAGATASLGTQQAGMMSIIVFWLAGLILLLTVREEH